MNLVVDKNIELLEFLLSNINNMSKNNIKSLLTNKGIYVNGKIVTKYNYLLNINDSIHIVTNFIKDSYFKRIEIIYEDKDLIAINKPANLLTIATSKEKDRTLYNIVSRYVKQKNKNNKIFIVHRLDKDTSGVIVFAKNQRIQKVLQDDWNNQVILREYIALVHGEVKETKTLKDYIGTDKVGNTFITNKDNGKLAITKYEVIKHNKSKSLLKIEIETGRKNQIRLQLSNDNHPIIGDKKIGIKDHSKRMYLHASKLILKHPVTKQLLELIAPVPEDFQKNVDKQ